MHSGKEVRKTPKIQIRLFKYQKLFIGFFRSLNTNPRSELQNSKWWIQYGRSKICCIL